ncbi:sugar-binding domain-containing protein [Parabacteroides chongii]|uniref:sugar-binding domain-containing protein n=1 Tax=Parabacteroides chongii TaxID=2685834 RepID=UPI00240CFCD6|nr:sugar-binding domain-containing protein [Parabacteroides chongii]WFE84270.1 glycoside hydrolase family 2 TIM barrel-domain containing protein [Parabacteroides chongii]
MNKKLSKVIFFLVANWCISAFAQIQNNQSLSGSWQFKLDPEDKGLKENWQGTSFTDHITLPGTTDEAHYGEKTSGSDFGILTRAYKYYGPAWYSREIEIPSEWNGKRIRMELERVLWESRVFVDGKEVSVQDALSTPHYHDLGYLSPGKHRLTIRINNDLIYNIGDKGHVYTEYTQSIWNGAVGRLQLKAVEAIHFSNPQVFTKVSPCTLQVTDTIMNTSAKKVDTRISWQLTERESGAVVFSRITEQLLQKGANVLDFQAAMPAGIKLWNDVTPNLYRLKVTVQDKKKTYDTREIEFGFREVTSSKSKIQINGKPVFLRGNLDCVHFPLTGYPSCKVEDWERIFRIYKDYGLNHVRFHSWCPPEAAFVAADRIGIYIQAETIWIDWWMSVEQKERKEMDTKGHPQGLGKNPSADRYVKQELHRMINAYGNHPSFVMQCIGNELGNSDFEVMESWIKPLRAKDSRRLYAVSTARKIMPVDQYMVTHYIDKLGATRGLRGGASTAWDFEDVYSQSNIPILSHEIGQWPVYPKWEEIKKYTGVLKARNLEEFREQARKNRIEEQNGEFVAASGALNQIMYKYEIESFLRTPSCAGIQLLSMQDYQGQGEALIGWLDVFYDSKGITTPEQFRAHHDTTVTLLRMPKYVWENKEPFTAEMQLAHYGTEDLQDGLYWKIKDVNSNLVASGETASRRWPVGSSELGGKISCDLSQITTAQKLTVEVGLQGRAIANRWNIWVYPSVNTSADRQKESTGTVYVTDRMDAACIKHLENGGKVLLQAAALGTEETCDKISYYPLYWSLTFFPGQGKNTIGMVVRDKHPLFAEFPTDSHSDWQWQSVYKDARAFYINDYPEAYKPIAQPVDDFHRNNKLAAIFELKVGKGKLVVCGFDLKDEKNPVARQLKKSILHYMDSEDFNPSLEKDIPSLQKMFTFVEPLKSTVTGEFSNALLYIDCANSDKTFANKKTTWKVSPGWQGKEMELTIECPLGIIGSLYVCFADKDKKGRTGYLVFEGRDYESGKQDQEESWVKLHIMREDSNDGILRLKAKVKNGPDLVISKVAIMEE